MNTRPKIFIKPSLIDYIFEIIAAVGIAYLILFPLFFYNDLPNEIPKHFNIHGEVDSYGNQNFILFLPIIGLVLYIGMTILNKYPHVFNYPSKVTVENAKKLYTIGTRSIRILKTFVVCLFTYLNFSIIQMASNNVNYIDKFFIPTILIVAAIILCITIFKIKKNKTTTKLTPCKAGKQ